MTHVPTDPEEASRLARRLAQEEFFENETFADLDLQGCELGGKEFYRCTFLRTQFQESRWRNSKLEVCVFNGCDLTRAQLKGTALRDVRFEGSKLMGVDFTEVSANPEMSFEDCVLRYASFVGLSLRKTAFLRCSALEANFFDLDLSEADFTGTNLAGSNFRGCTLTRTDFSQVSGLFLDPARNRLKGTRVPVETAVSLAQSLGMQVTGFDDEKSERRGRKKS
ncbi:pentapeptide repeat-containing protein [Archangium violaceum]|uniref:pentapeptide repeat-containing protein n=1 Tax=Archangium violaceum TaxID=83451 RepID=UPI00193C3522|nr:pentapeptide repeat-containing protein [Archangium violaceum]QRK08791.1 pentapeptide repeat-containing protein [Archangium violaceum]